MGDGCGCGLDGAPGRLDGITGELDGHCGVRHSGRVAGADVAEERISQPEPIFCDPKPGAGTGNVAVHTNLAMSERACDKARRAVSTIVTARLTIVVEVGA